MKINELKGNDQAKIILLNALSMDRLAHAYLFIGPEGVGKEDYARSLAGTFLCSEGQGDFCGICDSCRKFLSHNHPDFHLVEKEGASLKIEQIRKLQEKVFYRAYFGHGKVFLIKDAETMTIEASNAFLKILEEPPAKTLFILLANNYYTLLPTILSRCQLVYFYPLDKETIKESLLNSDSQLNPEDADFIATVCQGNLKKAYLLAKDSALLEERKNVLSLLIEIEQGKILKIFQIADLWDKEKEKLTDRLNLLESWYRDILVFKSTKSSQLLINNDYLDKLEAQSEKFSFMRLYSIIEKIGLAKQQLKANVSAKLVLENLLIELQGLRI